MIIDAGKKAALNLMKGTNGFKFIDIGDGISDSSTMHTILDHSVLSTRKSVTPELIGNVLIYTVDFTGSELASSVITELGIFDAASGGNMLSRVNFNKIGPLSADETVSFTFRLELV